MVRGGAERTDSARRHALCPAAHARPEPEELRDEI
jgi:hypothetical protein